ncbi:uncharacterized protein LOC126905746 [Daktulosphaira vitifoliae]|uniref:uncharacterized protein LOC126905746 n=1 Tax=Daktulosphaira vitifoliae TaxID=58002 RepID=UPI0021AA745D|nr:uncharacterized protein LOC126905746 [Daktulosphaira vitifoliae]
MLSAYLSVILIAVLAGVNVVCATVSITRYHKGDIFELSDMKCSIETCIGTSSGTASLLQSDTSRIVMGKSVISEENVAGSRSRLSTLPMGCQCQCIQPMPIFRDDMHICVDDLQECSLASFVSGTTVQKIPYVFLPLQGQIVYPSAEIKIAGMQYPMCAISRAKFLTRSGWVNFKNQSDFETPFQIHRENGHIMLLWMGNLQLRSSVEGRLVLVEMICKESIQDYEDNAPQTVTPCISFRIAGTPSVKEVLFSTDSKTSEHTPSNGLTISELVTIGICSVLLGLMYVASILLFLHVRKRRSKERTDDVEKFNNPNVSKEISEEGIVKNNPLLQHNYNDNESFEPDDDNIYNIHSPEETDTLEIVERSYKNRSLTTAIVHPNQLHRSFIKHSVSTYNSDSNSIEKHPEEDVSIVETLENKEDQCDNIRSIVCANPRRKLYFNPAYFQPELLLAPPPAALEFLDKIREVIYEAKRKIAMKKFTPNLIVIQEDKYEESNDKSSSCNKCNDQFKIKSDTIQKWLMDVPTEVTKNQLLTKSISPNTTVYANSKDLTIELFKQDELKVDIKVFNDIDDDNEEDASTNIECDSLERSTIHKQKSGYHTPSEYGNPRQELSPVLSNSSLPLEEELTINTSYTYDTVTKRESYYDHISGPDCVREKPKKEILPDILNRSFECYNLVSEVYVNDGFSTSLSPYNTLGNNIKKKSPGQITIEVEDCPDNHPVEDSDHFEPDTLDRISKKNYDFKSPLKPVYSTDFFEITVSSNQKPIKNGLNSLLEIYEAKSVIADVQKRWNISDNNNYLMPDPKHSRRQRCPSPPPIQNHPKNVCVRSTSKHGAMHVGCLSSQNGIKQINDNIASASDKRVNVLQNDVHKYEDSGYLSTESGESFSKSVAIGLDTDESGAESIDTDFKYFKVHRNRNYCDW